ncbi:MAG: hypothetical protein OXK21_04005 [Chloroflexota bacterium]|nr:hypothetical protein [Chloroflexota bacterium]
MGEEDGLGDRREGEVRVNVQTEMTIREHEDEYNAHPFRPSPEERERLDAETALHVAELLNKESDDPDVEVEEREPGNWRVLQQVKVDDSEMGSPFLLRLSREPASASGWERLRAALPDRYDTWTVTEDSDSLEREIECGLKRWLGLHEIAGYHLSTGRGWVEYSFDNFPPSVDVEEVLQVNQWFRKRRKYQDQEEYRFAWGVSIPQLSRLPDFVDIELTRTGLSLFQPWTPPER